MIWEQNYNEAPHTGSWTRSTRQGLKNKIAIHVSKKKKTNKEDLRFLFVFPYCIFLKFKFN